MHITSQSFAPLSGSALAFHNPLLRPLSQSTQATQPTPRAQRLAALGRCLLEQLDSPLIVLDSDGTVLEANAAAQRRMDERAGLWRDLGGRLAVHSGGRWLTLSRYATELAAGREVRVPLDADAGAETLPMQMLIQPMAPAEEGASSAPWMLAKIERARLSRHDTLRGRFRFTQTQARLAEMLCQGMRPTRAAEELGVKISTVRTHVGQMYEKTGTHTQAQLVALLARC